MHSCCHVKLTWLHIRQLWCAVTGMRKIISDRVEATPLISWCIRKCVIKMVSKSQPEFWCCSSSIKQRRLFCSVIGWQKLNYSGSLIEYLAPVWANKTKMAVGGNEDSLIGFLWINPLRRVQGVNCPKHTHTHTNTKDWRLPPVHLMKLCVCALLHKAGQHW